MDQDVKSFHVAPSTWSVLEATHDWINETRRFAAEKDDFDAFVTYVKGYGFVSHFLGLQDVTIDSGVQTIINHGCNGTYNYAFTRSLTEENVDLYNAPVEIYDAYAYSPVTERHLRRMELAGDFALRDIKAGEEILMNYLEFDAGDWWTDKVDGPRGQCKGSSVGEVTQYEIAHKK